MMFSGGHHPDSVKTATVSRGPSGPSPPRMMTPWSVHRRRGEEERRRSSVSIVKNYCTDYVFTHCKDMTVQTLFSNFLKQKLFLMFSLQIMNILILGIASMTGFAIQIYVQMEEIVNVIHDKIDRVIIKKGVEHSFLA